MCHIKIQKITVILDKHDQLHLILILRIVTYNGQINTSVKRSYDFNVTDATQLYH